ncbi:MAG: cupin domain-containing protein [Candidatus Woesearchaeota archaeon]
MIEIPKPWGKKTLLLNNHHYCLKLIELDKEAVLPLKWNERKHETLYVVDGKVHVRKHGDSFIAEKGRVIDIPPGTLHTLTALEFTRLFDVSTP